MSQYLNLLLLPQLTIYSKPSSLNKIPVIDIIRYLIIGILFINFFCLSACSSEKKNPVDVDNEDGECPAEQWDFDTSGEYAYTHDCNPYASDHFTVYSDGSSLESKRQLAEIAEEVFDELVTEFLITSIEDELQFTEDYTYYIYAEKYIDPIQAMGFRNGFFIGAIDCVTIPNYYLIYRYRSIVKHELTHVFQFTLTNCPKNSLCPEWLGFWFREGQAHLMSDAGDDTYITTLEQFYDWYAAEGHVNPISIHRWSDFPDKSLYSEYYCIFATAYAYLIDTTNGYGAEMEDIRELFQLMKEGYGFEEAFQISLGISVEWYRENFYTLMEEYLKKPVNATSPKIKNKMNFEYSESTGFHNYICDSISNDNVELISSKYLSGLTSDGCYKQAKYR